MMNLGIHFWCRNFTLKALTHFFRRLKNQTPSWNLPTKQTLREAIFTSYPVVIKKARM